MNLSEITDQRRSGALEGVRSLIHNLQVAYSKGDIHAAARWLRGETPRDIQRASTEILFAVEIAVVPQDDPDWRTTREDLPLEAGSWGHSGGRIDKP